jgi:hypothetical protein
MSGPEAATVLKLRTSAYLSPPKAFDVAPCDCGNHETQWSEYEGHLWCAKCEKDFVPAHNGVFDGPVLLRTAAAMGVRFDRYLLPTMEVEIMDLETCEYRRAEPHELTPAVQS